MTPQTLVMENQDVRLQKPSLYAVILHNDDITTMDFVVQILVEIFHKQPADAAALMLDVHENGQAIAGVYVFDIAATKKSQADRIASQNGFPLKLTIREVQS